MTFLDIRVGLSLVRLTVLWTVAVLSLAAGMLANRFSTELTGACWVLMTITELSTALLLLRGWLDGWIDKYTVV